MSQIIQVNKVKTSVRRGCAAILTAIVVILPHLASAETPGPLSMPAEMASKMLAPDAGEEALNTPFFNAKEEPVTLSDLKGRGLVVNFWATWCVPCLREMPSLDRLSKALEGTGVEVLAISEDRKALDVVPQFLKSKGFDNLDLNYDPRGLLSRKFGISGLPSTILINADGVFLGRVLGTLEWDAKDVKAFLLQDLAPKVSPAN
ncbi:MAG: TlpA family protein disulfide reductase [Magnetovibrio sp.]|nr:TlpA family protein disulfide reductase [Magnetovibrio sp.]